MSNKKKIIQINPELFKLSGNKTRKNREKKEAPSLNPIVSPNNLKNKLLKRIKEHKTKELKQPDTNNTNTNTYSDEFFGAINYLSDLSKKQKQQQYLNNKTLKNNTTTITTETVPSYGISLDLPPELSENYKPNLQSLPIF